MFTPPLVNYVSDLSTLYGESTLQSQVLGEKSYEYSNILYLIQ